MLNPEGWGWGESWGEERSLGAQGASLFSVPATRWSWWREDSAEEEGWWEMSPEMQKRTLWQELRQVCYGLGWGMPSGHVEARGEGQGHRRDTGACFKGHLKSSKWAFGGDDETFLRKVTSWRKSMSTRSWRACHPPWKNWPHGWQQVVRGWAGQT